MFERLILMRELLSEKGSIYLHCDWHKSHHLRMLLDEVFGEQNFVNEIIWCYTGPSRKNKFFPRKHDTIHLYSKVRDHIIFNMDEIKIPYKKTRTGTSKGSAFLQDDYEMDEAGKVPEDWWDNITPVGRKPHELLGFPTQKTEALIERIIKVSSNEDSIVLDCFVGSGTTAVVAEKLRRRWIAADLNRGAIQTTMKRIQTTIAEHRGIAHYRINNYHFSEQQELRRLLIEKYGIETDKKDRFFDGTVDGTLVKIVELTKPLTRLDIQLIKDELQHRPDETRAVTVLCNGSELGIQAELDAENKHHPINKLIVRDIQRDGVTTFAPAEAEVAFKRDRQHVTITLVDYISPSLLGRLEIARTLFDEQVDDFRAQIDCVLIDTDYNGTHFRIVASDVPEKQREFIKGQYTVVLPRRDARVAVKIIDMLGEETVVTE